MLQLSKNSNSSCCEIWNNRARIWSFTDPADWYQETRTRSNTMLWQHFEATQGKRGLILHALLSIDMLILDICASLSKILWRYRPKWNAKILKDKDWLTNLPKPVNRFVYNPLTSHDGIAVNPFWYISYRLHCRVDFSCLLTINFY